MMVSIWMLKAFMNPFRMMVSICIGKNSTVNFSQLSEFMVQQKMLLTVIILER